MVSRWPPTSVPRISSKTGSTRTAVVSPAAPSGVAASNSPAGTCGSRAGATSSRTSSPAPRRSATPSIAARSTDRLASPRRAACSCGNTSRTCDTNATTAGLAERDPSSTRFSMFSTCQLNSPSVFAPTSRPLPLSVWKTRRIGRNCSRSSGPRRQTGRSSSRLAISSWNSSRKISRISSSISSPAASKPALSAGVPGCVVTTTAATGSAGDCAGVSSGAAGIPDSASAPWSSGCWPPSSSGQYPSPSMLARARSSRSRRCPSGSRNDSR